MNKLIGLLIGIDIEKGTMYGQTATLISSDIYLKKLFKIVKEVH